LRKADILKATKKDRPGVTVGMQESEKTTISIGGRELVLSNLNKVFYPAKGFTKAQVIDYYSRIAPAVLPHLRGRPVTLKRFPDGGSVHWGQSPVHPGLL
jgi:hypothetical protein